MVSEEASSPAPALIGVPEHVASGVWRIELPLADSEVTGVAVHVVTGRDGRPFLVDAGFDSPESRAALDAGLAALGVRIEDVAGVLLTHAHPDHHGLSAEIAARSGAWVAIHARDAAVLGLRGDALSGELDRWRRWLDAAGVPDARREALVDLSARMLEHFRVPVPGTVFSGAWHAPPEAGDIVAIELPGHSNGQVGFHDRARRVVFTGDALLRGALPSLPSNPITQRDPVSVHRRTLDRLVRLDADRLLPGHGPPIADIAAEVASTRARLARRLARAAAALADGPATAWEVAERLPRSRPLIEFSLLAQRAMLGETLGLLHALEREGRIVRRPGPPDRWSARE